MSESEQRSTQEQTEQSPGAAAPGQAAAPEQKQTPAGPQAAQAAEDLHTQENEQAADGAAEEIQGDLDELVKTAAQRDEYLALAQRTQADFENYRKRVARDLSAAQERGVAKLAKELLPALDNLDRAVEAAQAEDPLLEGVKLVRSELGAALARVGIEQFAPLGERFDPNEHEAMAQAPIEGFESGTVAEVYQNGYRLNGTVIRPARVLVAA